MSDTKLLQITDDAWVVQKGITPLGILNKDYQDNYVFVSGKHCQKFESETQVMAHFQDNTIFIKKEYYSSPEPLRVYIKGHEIPYPEAIAIDDNDPLAYGGLPLFFKKPSSDIVYAAGFYAINYNYSWAKAHNPKLNTLIQYGYEGPWKTRSEMRNNLRRLNQNRASRSSISNIIP